MTISVNHPVVKRDLTKSYPYLLHYLVAVLQHQYPVESVPDINEEVIELIEQFNYVPAHAVHAVSRSPRRRSSITTACHWRHRRSTDWSVGCQPTRPPTCFVTP